MQKEGAKAFWNLKAHRQISKKRRFEYCSCDQACQFSASKRRLKVQETIMSCERALNFDQWKTFSENYKPMRVWLWLVYKFTENYSLAAFLWIHSNSKEVSYLSWQNTYPNSKTTCHIKLKFFLQTKLLENLLLAKYLTSVTASLSGGL